jgi:RNA polymerase sigma-70 factor (ECF subfamily)
MNLVQNMTDRLETISEEFRSQIFAYIRSKIGDSSTADDLTQETFIKVENALAKGTEPEHFRGWLFQIARNTVIDSLKEARRFVPFEETLRGKETDESGISDTIDNEFRQTLFCYTQKILGTLPAEDREALRLTELDGLSREELASELGLSLSGAKSRVLRARAKLRKAIEECCRLVTDPYGRVIDWKKRGSPCCGPKKSAT